MTNMSTILSKSIKIFTIIMVIATACLGILTLGYGLLGQLGFWIGFLFLAIVGIVTLFELKI